MKPTTITVADAIFNWSVFCLNLNEKVMQKINFAKRRVGELQEQYSPEMQVAVTLFADEISHGHATKEEHDSSDNGVKILSASDSRFNELQNNNSRIMYGTAIVYADGTIQLTITVEFDGGSKIQSHITNPTIGLSVDYLNQLTDYSYE